MKFVLPYLSVENCCSGSGIPIVEPFLHHWTVGLGNPDATKKFLQLVVIIFTQDEQLVNYISV